MHLGRPEQEAPAGQYKKTSSIAKKEKPPLKHYRQLTLEQRYQIATLFAMRKTTTEIANAVGTHRTTVYRELRRNGRDGLHKRNYTALAAQQTAGKRRAQKAARSRKIRGDLQRLVELKLRLGWSPEQICGRLKLEHGVSLSHETVYQHVLRDALAGGKLRYSLRHRGYGYRRFRQTRYVRKPPAQVRTIAERPAAANERLQIGHWERDLVVSAKNSSSLLTIVDRKSRLTLIRWVTRPTASIVNAQTLDALSPFTSVNKTLTNDNGSEFKTAAALEASLGIPIYFTDPGAPWQRGTVENTNGLIRQYYPKRTGGIADEFSWCAEAIEQTLNTRPRKTLGYRTPHEAFFDQKLTLLSGPLLRFGLETNQPS